MVSEVITTSLVAAGTGLIRNVIGWFENSYITDKVIQPYEWKELATTVLRFVLVSAGIYFAFDTTAIQTAAIALLVDIPFTKLVNKK